jgi:hypothetical protein
MKNTIKGVLAGAMTATGKLAFAAAVIGLTVSAGASTPGGHSVVDIHDGGVAKPWYTDKWFSTPPASVSIPNLVLPSAQQAAATGTTWWGVKIPSGGGNFLPAYMDYLQGKSAMPKDTCEAHTLADLMLGNCDQGGAR